MVAACLTGYSLVQLTTSHNVLKTTVTKSHFVENWNDIEQR